MPAVVVEGESEATCQEVISDAPFCRLCWGEADTEQGGCLVAPCACTGSSQFIHVRCLQAWQQTLRAQGRFKKALHCEVCKHEYRHMLCSRCSRQGPCFCWLVDLSYRVLGVFNCASWPLLAFRVWKHYVLVSGVLNAARVGFKGLKAGLTLGRALVEEQTALLLNLLTALGDVIGTPYAELLWCQALGTLLFALLSELVYTSVVGLLSGLVFGFCHGYVLAVRNSARAVTSVCMKLVSFATRASGRPWKHLSSLLLRRFW